MNVRPLVKAKYFDEGALLHHILKYHYKLIKHNQRAVTSDNWGKVIPYYKIIEICIKKAERFLLGLDLDVELGQTVIEIYKEYAVYYQSDNWKVLEVEKPFAKTLYNDDNLKVVYCGLIDLVTTIAVVDHKSSKRRGVPSPLSNQFIGYCWATEVNNFVINKVGFQKTLKPEEKFERPPYSYFPAIIEEWKNNTIKDCVELYDFLTNHPADLSTRRNLTSCDKYDGCIFGKICQTHPEAREFLIKHDYQIGEPWRPIKGLEVE
jgi:hypothetical protein